MIYSDIFQMRLCVLRAGYMYLSLSVIRYLCKSSTKKKQMCFTSSSIQNRFDPPSCRATEQVWTITLTRTEFYLQQSTRTNKRVWSLALFTLRRFLEKMTKYCCVSTVYMKTMYVIWDSAVWEQVPEREDQKNPSFRCHIDRKNEIFLMWKLWVIQSMTQISRNECACQPVLTQGK